MASSWARAVSTAIFLHLKQVGAANGTPVASDALVTTPTRNCAMTRAGPLMGPIAPDSSSKCVRSVMYIGRDSIFRRDLSFEVDPAPPCLTADQRISETNSAPTMETPDHLNPLMARALSAAGTFPRAAAPGRYGELTLPARSRHFGPPTSRAGQVKACVTPAQPHKRSNTLTAVGQVLHKPRGRKPRRPPR